MEEILSYAVNIGIWFFDSLGILVMLFSGIKAGVDLIRRRNGVRVNLAKGMALGLEFKLGGEILRTVVVRTFSEIAIIACIIALRAGLTFLIHWEIRHGKEEF